MVAQPASSAAWKVTALSGIGLIAIGIGAAYLCDTTRLDFEFISDHFDVFALGILVGVVLSVIGLIGWAKQLERQRRALMAVLVFLSPWLAMLLAYPIAGANMHGGAGLVGVLIIPASVLALILFFMTVAAPKAGARSEAPSGVEGN